MSGPRWPCTGKNSGALRAAVSVTLPISKGSQLGSWEMCHSWRYEARAAKVNKAPGFTSAASFGETRTERFKHDRFNWMASACPCYFRVLFRPAWKCLPLYFPDRILRVSHATVCVVWLQSWFWHTTQSLCLPLKKKPNQEISRPVAGVKLSGSMAHERLPETQSQVSPNQLFICIKWR